MRRPLIIYTFSLVWGIFNGTCIVLHEKPLIPWATMALIIALALWMYTASIVKKKESVRVGKSTRESRHPIRDESLIQGNAVQGFIQESAQGSVHGIRFQESKRAIRSRKNGKRAIRSRKQKSGDGDSLRRSSLSDSLKNSSLKEVFHLSRKEIVICLVLLLLGAVYVAADDRIISKDLLPLLGQEGVNNYEAMQILSGSTVAKTGVASSFSDAPHSLRFKGLAANIEEKDDHLTIKVNNITAVQGNLEKRLHFNMIINVYNDRYLSASNEDFRTGINGGAETGLNEGARTDLNEGSGTDLNEGSGTDSDEGLNKKAISYELHEGDIISFTGAPELPDPARNPGCFDYRKYLRSIGISAKMTVSEVQLVRENSDRLRYFAYGLRTRENHLLDQRLGDAEASLIKGMLFGETETMDDEMYERFQKNGLLYIMAVSGMHLMLLYGMIAKITARFGRKRSWLSESIIASVLLIYCAVAGFTPSVVRAFVMILVHMTGTRLMARYDMMCCTCASMIILLAIEPWSIFNTGFQLSFLAILSFAVLMPVMQRKIKGVLLPMFTVQAGMLPFTAYLFNYISIGAFFANIPAAFLASIMVPAGLISTALGSLGRAAGGGSAGMDMNSVNSGLDGVHANLDGLSVDMNGVFADLNGMFPDLNGVPTALNSVFTELNGLLIDLNGTLADFFIKFNDFTFANGRLTFDVVSPKIWMLVIYYACLFFFCSEAGQILWMRRDNIAITKYIACAFIAAIIVQSAFLTGFENAAYTFVDVGQGDCMHLRATSGSISGNKEQGLIGNFFKNKSKPAAAAHFFSNKQDTAAHLFRKRECNILIDGGGKADFDMGEKTLKPYLLKNGVRSIELAIVTHLHTDHYDGIRSLCRMGMVKKLCMYEGYKVDEDQILQECGMDKHDLIYVTAGDVLKLGDAEFTILAPPARTDEEYRILAEDEEDENKKSLLIKVEYHGVSAMMTGDIGEDGENEVLRKLGNNDSKLQCDILKVGHHGSKYSSGEAFLDAVDPRVAVIQVGEHNMYGHPTPETIGRLEARDIPVYRNDKMGAVGLKIEQGAIKEVRTMIHNIFSE